MGSSGTSVLYRGCMVPQKKILFRKKLRAGNAWYHSVQNLLSSRLLSKNLKIKICRTIILPVVLYGCETWLVTLREERRLRVFDNRVLRRVFGPKRDVTGEWRKLHNEELRDLYSVKLDSNYSRRNWWMENTVNQFELLLYLWEASRHTAILLAAGGWRNALLNQVTEFP